MYECIVQKVETKKNLKKLLTKDEICCIIMHVDISKTDADGFGSEGGLKNGKEICKKSCFGLLGRFGYFHYHSVAEGEL